MLRIRLVQTETGENDSMQKTQLSFRNNNKRTHHFTSHTKVKKQALSAVWSSFTGFCADC